MDQAKRMLAIRSCTDVTPEAGGRVVAVVKDLFFVARIREVARLAGVPIEFARTPEDLETAFAAAPASLVLMDLTTPGWDYAGFFAAIDAVAPRPTVLAFTTHALATQTKPLHARCDRVVTKETLTQELGDILRGVPR
jgi:CheY-like chemotaxis protein